MPRVLNKRTDKIQAGAVYVGRPSKWGNPYAIPKDGNREEVIRKYHTLIINSKEYHSGELRRKLGGKDLVCWCSPLPCHAGILLELANKDTEVCPECHGKGKQAYAGTSVPIYVGECIICNGSGKKAKPTSQFHCFKCHRTWKREDANGKIVYSDGTCADCLEADQIIAIMEGKE